MTGTESHRERSTTAAAASASAVSQQQQQQLQQLRHGSASSLAEQIRSFNRQQFASDIAKTSSDVNAILLAADSDDNDDDEQQRQRRRTSSSGAHNALDTTSALDVSGYESEDDEVDDDEAAAFAMMSTLQLLQSRSVHKPSRDVTPRATTSSVSTNMELRHAEERIGALEAQLLDAEETICHLKAEKLAARRDVERLALSLAALSSGTNSSDRVATEALPSSSQSSQSPVNIWTTPPSSERDKSEGTILEELHSNQDSDVTDRESQSLEHDELRAVIREQEREIQKLTVALARMSETCDDLDARLVEAYALPSPQHPNMSHRRRSTAPTDDPSSSNSDDASSNDDDSDSHAVLTPRRHRHSSDSIAKPRYRATSSLDSSASDVTQPSSTGAVSTPDPFVVAPSAASVPAVWTEELVRHPTPYFDLDSPEVLYVLTSWTANVPKLQYLRLWLAQVASARAMLGADVPRGVELPRLPLEVRDAFLTLVVPLLRRQTQRDVVVHSRLCSDAIHADLRIRVEPRS